MNKKMVMPAVAALLLSACGSGGNSNPVSEACGTDSPNCSLGFEAGKGYVEEIKKQGGEVVADPGETCLTIVSINGFSGSKMDAVEWRIGCEKAIAAFR